MHLHGIHNNNPEAQFIEFTSSFYSNIELILKAKCDFLRIIKSLSKICSYFQHIFDNFTLFYFISNSISFCQCFIVHLYSDLINIVVFCQILYITMNKLNSQKGCVVLPEVYQSKSVSKMTHFESLTRIFKFWYIFYWMMSQVYQNRQTSSCFW